MLVINNVSVFILLSCVPSVTLDINLNFAKWCGYHLQRSDVLCVGDIILNLNGQDCQSLLQHQIGNFLYIWTVSICLMKIDKSDVCGAFS
jgi:hypothetical protein